MIYSQNTKCPASASVVCCDLLYFVVYFRIRYRLNAIKYIFRTFYHWKTLPWLKHIISKTKVAIFADKPLFATEKQNKVQ